MTNRDALIDNFVIAHNKAVLYRRALEEIIADLENAIAQEWDGCAEPVDPQDMLRELNEIVRRIEPLK